LQVLRLRSLIAGLEDVTQRDILIGDKVVNDVAPKSRDIAMVFQNYALYPQMTVAQNMGFALKMARSNAAEIERRVHRAADILGLTQLLDRYPKQLSGGQRQRVAMGRAIVRDPQVFLFDEPLSNLDAKLRVQMRTEIKELQQRLGTTTVYVTHDQVEAMTMADRIVVMREGRIEQVGRPLQLYDEPANLFVAGFLGSPAMNFIHGDLRDGRFIARGGFELPLSQRHRNLSCDDVIYGIRPEHLSVRADGVPMTVSVLEPTGAEIQVFARLGEQHVVAAVRERVEAAPGALIALAPQLDRVHLFSAATGLRVDATRATGASVH